MPIDFIIYELPKALSTFDVVVGAIGLYAALALTVHYLGRY